MNQTEKNKKSKFEDQEFNLKVYNHFWCNYDYALCGCTIRCQIENPFLL